MQSIVCFHRCKQDHQTWTSWYLIDLLMKGSTDGPYFHVSIDLPICSSIHTSSSTNPGPGRYADRLCRLFQTSLSLSTHSSPNKRSRCVPGPNGIIQQSIQQVRRWLPGLLPVGHALAISLSRHPNQMPKPSQLPTSKGKKQQFYFQPSLQKPNSRLCVWGRSHSPHEANSCWGPCVHQVHIKNCQR